MSVISVKNVTKKYKNHYDKKATLKEKVLNLNKIGDIKESVVLNDINLDIEKGEVIGLIGRNGSGKSTLLKLLSRIIYPDTGTIEMHGRVSSLLELGAGFHPDFTGLENIYMNASILGMSKKEINDNLDSILSFADLGEFIYRPVRTYSSGMYMRLAFSIAINVDPDILLIDEILSVGDAAFQNKCINRIRELMKANKTIVIVSHDNGMIEKLCTKAVWLYEGKVREIGRPKHVISSYLEMLNDDENKSRLEEQRVNHIELKDENSNNAVIENVSEKTRWGNQSIQITQIGVFSGEEEQQVFKTNSQMSIKFDFRVNDLKAKDDVVFGIGVFTTDGICCYGTNTQIDGFIIREMGDRGTVIFDVSDLNLVNGDYYIDIAIHREDGTPYDYFTRCITFAVRSSINDVGIVRFQHEWRLISQ